MNFREIINTYRSIAISGTYKNVGKTVALNELIQIASSEDKTIGLTSIGIDGEKIDSVTMTEKPLIRVPKGTIYATAESCLKDFKTSSEVLEVTDYATAIGRVMILKCLEDGFVEIAGPDTNEELKLVIAKMRSFGADVIFVDGALSRKTQASPAIAEGVILSTGAVLSRDMKVVIEKTKHMVNLFNLPKVSEGKEVYIKAINLPYVSFVDVNDCIVPTKYVSALGVSRDIINEITKDYKAIVIPGALVNSFIKKLIPVLRASKLKIIVRDGTRVFVDYQDYKIFEKLGGRIEVIDKVNLLAVTVNSVSVDGYYFDGEIFLSAMKEALYPIDVYDCMLGGDHHGLSYE